MACNAGDEPIYGLVYVLLVVGSAPKGVFEVAIMLVFARVLILVAVRVA